MFERTHNPDGPVPDVDSGRRAESLPGLSRLEGLIKMSTGVNARVVKVGTVRRSFQQSGIRIIELSQASGTVIDSRGLDPNFPDLLSRSPLTDGLPADFLPFTGSNSAQSKGGNVDRNA